MDVPAPEPHPVEPPADGRAAPASGFHPRPPSAAEATAARRADVDAKHAAVAAMLPEVDCDAALLLLPPHVSWVTAGMNVRGLIADSERPAVYLTAQHRWLLCSRVDSHRLFEEELDQLGFQLKEWPPASGRAEFLLDVVAGRKVAADRPYPHMPMLNDRLRPALRVLSAHERAEYLELGRLLAHALEATARSLQPGDTEEEAAGQLGHRLLRHGAEPAALSVTADGRGKKFRRAGFTPTAVTRTCVLQATAGRAGLFATACRAVSFGPPPEEFRAEHDLAVRVAAAYRALARPDETQASAAAAGQWVLANTPYEFDGRLSVPVYGAGRYAAEELKRGGTDGRFVPHQPLVWQARVGAAAVVDTLVVTADGPVPVTPPGHWPFKRVRIKDAAYDIPDVLVRGA